MIQIQSTAAEFVADTQPIKVKGKQQLVEVFQPRVGHTKLHASARSVDELSRRMLSRDNSLVASSGKSARARGLLKTGIAAARLKSGARAGVNKRAVAAANDAVRKLDVASVTVTPPHDNTSNTSDASAGARSAAAKSATVDNEEKEAAEEMEDEDEFEDEVSPAMMMQHGVFFGREKEMQALRSAYAPLERFASANLAQLDKADTQRAAPPHARVVIVNGEAGMGK